MTINRDPDVHSAARPDRPPVCSSRAWSRSRGLLLPLLLGTFSHRQALILALVEALCLVVVAIGVVVSGPAAAGQPRGALGAGPRATS